MITFEIPIRTVSEANTREHWAAKAKRAKMQRCVARLLMLSNMTPEISHRLIRCKEPLMIRITQIGKRKLDSDNLARSQKAVRDGIAEAIGIDDGSELLEWEYSQEIGKQYSVKVEIR